MAPKDWNINLDYMTLQTFSAQVAYDIWSKEETNLNLEYFLSECNCFMLTQEKKIKKSVSDGRIESIFSEIFRYIIEM